MSKQFNLAVRDKDREPIDTFEIPIKDEDGTVTRIEKFDLYRPADSAALMAMNLATRFHKTASDRVQMQAIAATIDYLGACMDPGQHQTLYELLVSPEFGMDTEELIDLCKWAVETIAARPTLRSTGSRAGRPPAGKKSTARARSGGSTRSRSR